jgi:hypothetical protein
MRDSLLNESLFFDLDHARGAILKHAQDYNTTDRARRWAVERERTSPTRGAPAKTPHHLAVPRLRWLLKTRSTTSHQRQAPIAAG